MCATSALHSVSVRPAAPSRVSLVHVCAQRRGGDEQPTLRQSLITERSHFSGMTPALRPPLQHAYSLWARIARCFLGRTLLIERQLIEQHKEFGPLKIVVEKVSAPRAPLSGALEYARVPQSTLQYPPRVRSRGFSRPLELRLCVRPT